jgi:predicted O-methyltransferase YrrM
MNYLHYLEKAIELAEPGAIIAADNLFLGGKVLDESYQGPSPTTIREFNRRIATDPRLEAVLLTIGDGLGICRVK